MENHLDLPENLRERILTAVDKAIAANMKIGSNAIEVGGAVVLQKGFLDDPLAKVLEIRTVLFDEAIQQS